MDYQRSAGILCHPSSFPGKYGIGDLGPEAYHFIDFLAACGQTLWQVFPLGPTGYGDSPYQCFSAFAGNPLLISPELLYQDGLLTQEQSENTQKFDQNTISFGEIIDFKTHLLKLAFSTFKKHKKHPYTDALAAFEKDNKDWLEDYSLFMATKAHFGGVQWTQWDKAIALRKRGAVKEWKEKLADEILYQKFIQYVFVHQWKAVKQYANQKNIKVIGDLPIFIAYDSADLWANKELFTVDENGGLIYVAGVPPDYFSPTGQLWGNPLYRWEEMEKDDFLWWRKRFAHLLEFVDIIRIDHFRGFEAYWRIPGDAPTAETGKWIKAPGKKLFTAVAKYLGDIPILAEDLGVITKEVEELRDHFRFPGMKILQFAFGTDMEKKFLPHNFVKNCVVYTGSHDNDTTRGYFEKAKTETNDIYSFTRQYLNYFGENICGELIRAAYASPANIVIIPLQDVLNLGSEARMNFPGRLGGNWTWRYVWNQVNSETPALYRHYCDLYERPPKEKHS
jgi:4-alpha-glucanotransferase